MQQHTDPDDCQLHVGNTRVHYQADRANGRFAAPFELRSHDGDSQSERYTFIILPRYMFLSDFRSFSFLPIGVTELVLFAQSEQNIC